MLSESPEEATKSMEEYYAFRRDFTDKQGAEGNDNTLCDTVDSMIYAISYHCFLSDEPPQFFDDELHAFWYAVIQAAKNYNMENPKQFELLRHILYARELGTLVRHFPTDTTDPPKTKIAQASDGSNIWSDLPYCTRDIPEAWSKHLSSMSTLQRINFAAFIARLVSVGIHSDLLAGCAVALLRDALETPRRMTTSDEGSEVSIAELLPAVNAWLTLAPHKLLSLSMESFNELSSEVLALGPLAQSAGVVSGGFSPSRWNFWRNRLDSISQSGQEEVTKLGLDSLNRMKVLDGFYLASIGSADWNKSPAEYGTPPEWMNKSVATRN